MSLITPTLLRVILLLFFILLQFSCAKDSDILGDSAMNNSDSSNESPGEFGELTEDGFEARTIILSPIHDAYVQGDEGYNYSIVRLEEDNRRSYLMFDLSAIDGEITSTILEFTVNSDEGDGTVKISKGLSSEWTEDNLNGGNAPGIDAELGRIIKTFKLGNTEKVNINASNIYPEPLSLVLTHLSGNDIALASKEHPANIGPKLIVTYKAIPGSPNPFASDETANDSQNNDDEETSGSESAPPDEGESDENSQADSSPDESQNETSNENEAVEENRYYVTTSGSANNDGRSEASAWSINHAFANAMGGDVVYIKAGNYGNVELDVDNSGSKDNPIRFVGYTNAAGDLDSSQGSTFTYGDSIDAGKMPLIEGNGNGTSIEINEPYIELENIQIRNFEKGIVSYGSHNKLINIILHDFGSETGYSGNGVIMNGDYSQMSNCFILNVNAQAFTSTGAENQVIEYNWIGFDATNKADDYSTDYYLLLSYSDNNEVRNNTIYRKPGTFHQGHGIIVKGGGKYNYFLDNIIYNTAFEFSFSEVAYNTIEGGQVIGTGSEYALNTGAERPYAFILIANGAHHNTFDGLYIEGDSGVRFSDWNDGFTPSPDTDAVDAGHNNEFRNITFTNLLSAIEFSWQWNGPGTARDNIFDNCVFENIQNEVFRTERGNYGTIVRNSSFRNNDAVFNRDDENIGRVPNGGQPWPLNVDFQNCEWTNNSFAPPN